MGDDLRSEEPDKRNAKFTVWRKQAANDLASLAARVFALRGTGYYGSGFHWSLEKRLGYVMLKLNDYDDGSIYHDPAAEMLQDSLMLFVSLLYEDVAEAETTAGR